MASAAATATHQHQTKRPSRPVVRFTSSLLFQVGCAAVIQPHEAPTSSKYPGHWKNNGNQAWYCAKINDCTSLYGKTTPQNPEVDMKTLDNIRRWTRQIKHFSKTDVRSPYLKSVKQKSGTGVWDISGPDLTTSQLPKEPSFYGAKHNVLFFYCCLQLDNQPINT